MTEMAASPGPKPGETTKYRFRSLLTNIDHDVRVEQVARVHLHAFAFLGKIRPAIRKFQVVGQDDNKVKRVCQIIGLFPQNNFSAPTENLHFLAP